MYTIILTNVSLLHIGELNRVNCGTVQMYLRMCLALLQDAQKLLCQHNAQLVGDVNAGERAILGSHVMRCMYPSRTQNNGSLVVSSPFIVSIIFHVSAAAQLHGELQAGFQLRFTDYEVSPLPDILPLAPLSVRLPTDFSRTFEFREILEGIGWSCALLRLHVTLCCSHKQWTLLKAL